MKLLTAATFQLLPLLAFAAPEVTPQVFLAGDSTMADKPLDLPERGWGMVLPRFFTDPATTFRDNLRRFVRDVRAKQASPILATPVARRNFDPAGKLQPTHGAYPDAVRAVAAGEKVPLIELERATAVWLQATGDEPSKPFFMWIEPGKFPKLPEGKKDDTHFVEAGATHVAELAVAEIRQLNLPLAHWLK